MNLSCLGLGIKDISGRKRKSPQKRLWEVCELEGPFSAPVALEFMMDLPALGMLGFAGLNSILMQGDLVHVGKFLLGGNEGGRARITSQSCPVTGQRHRLYGTKFGVNTIKHICPGDAFSWS